MDENGNYCAEKHTSSYQVTNNLAYPEVYFVMDEVRGSTSQKADRYIGVRLIVCYKGVELQNKINIKERMDAPWTYLTQ